MINMSVPPVCIAVRSMLGLERRQHGSSLRLSETGMLQRGGCVLCALVRSLHPFSFHSPQPADPDDTKQSGAGENRGSSVGRGEQSSATARRDTASMRRALR